MTILDFEETTPATERTLRSFEESARSIRITVSYDSDPALVEVFSNARKRRETLLERGYEERTFPIREGRPDGLATLEKELFRDDAHRRPQIPSTQGLRVIGAPNGEGTGLLVAREIRRLEESGVDPSEILVLFRHWNEEIDVITDVIRSWEIPVTTVGRPRPLRTDPAVSSLRQLASIPREGWEVSAIVGLLRNSRFQPAWIESSEESSAAPAASALVKTKVFQGKAAIESGLDRSSRMARKEQRPALQEAREIIDRFIAALEPLDQSGDWQAHVDRLEEVAEEFGLASNDGVSLEELWEAIEEHGAVLAELGTAGYEVPFEHFGNELEALVDDLSIEDNSIIPGRVVVTTLDHAEGARAKHILLVNLVEGTFPSIEAVEAVIADPKSTAYGREMGRFLRVIGSAEDSVTFVYPTRDEKGQAMLAAAFVDDLIRRIDPVELAKIHEVHDRLDPMLLDHPDLAGSPSDARVRAVAMACVHGQASDLARLARDPRHRPALLGAASALGLEQARSVRTRAFTCYEGRLDDPVVVDSIADRFGPECTFSPSQLETYLLCPFRFFLQYVSKLEPVVENDDLEEDRTVRGQRVHEALEKLERQRINADENILELDVIEYTTSFAASLSDDSETDPGRREIERRWMLQTLRRYESQAEAYAAKLGGARPQHFELGFGHTDDPESYPHLLIGFGADAVRLRGSIDRVDLTLASGESRFRVIDYKTGSAPTKKQVEDLSVLQLPLYAQAIESLEVAGESARLLDVGYWELAEKGYRPIVPRDWPELQARVEAKVLEIAALIRGGHFEVEPREKDCTRSCDYANVCRIKQVRIAGKGSAEDPT